MTYPIISFAELKSATTSLQVLSDWEYQRARFFLDKGMRHEARLQQKNAAYSSAHARQLLLALLAGEYV